MESVQSAPPLVVLAYDDWIVGWVIRTAFERAGYRLLAYPSAVVPFHIIKRERPALVVVERTLAPGIVGYPLIDDMRRDSETAAIPVVLYTPPAGDLPPPSERVRTVAKTEPVAALLDAARELLTPPA